uniref:Uncharacterized protein n=1 Tax=Candidatus Kentrum sp. FW TaxID=2126338 RepID=A0A450SXQ4_9GAMM|nr:MAG: hypothetical protein BECKFW1821B_GA0114236_10447 [Candidatus Kentron sp. FW]VFJ60831.1 MAG: hypothetical protein BECKFW1821A_GA0114235_11081 [Candidatus Kentron sp. FW]
MNRPHTQHLEMGVRGIPTIRATTLRWEVTSKEMTGPRLLEMNTHKPKKI